MPGKSAFLSSAYCVIVPFMMWMVERKKPSRYNIYAAILCTAGILAASLTEGGAVTKGDGLALLSAVLFAAHIASVAICGRGKDPILITILQFGFSAVFSWIVTLATGLPASNRMDRWNGRRCVISGSGLYGTFSVAAKCGAEVYQSVQCVFDFEPGIGIWSFVWGDFFP